MWLVFPHISCKSLGNSSYSQHHSFGAVSLRVEIDGASSANECVIVVTCLISSRRLVPVFAGGLWIFIPLFENTRSNPPGFNFFETLCGTVLETAGQPGVLLLG